MRSIAKGKYYECYSLYLEIAQRVVLLPRCTQWLRAPGRSCNLASESASCMAERCGFGNRFSLRLESTPGCPISSQFKCAARSVPSPDSLSWLLVSLYIRLLKSPRSLASSTVPGIFGVYSQYLPSPPIYTFLQKFLDAHP